MRRELIGILAAMLLVGPVSAWAAESEQQSQGGQMQQEQAQQTQEQVYGWQLMSDTERRDYRQRMRELHTEEEREALRREHHAQMQERARQLGVTLPDEPGPYRKGLGGGQGRGGRW
jgi:hypothetical protein